MLLFRPACPARRSRDACDAGVAVARARSARPPRHLRQSCASSGLRAFGFARPARGLRDSCDAGVVVARASGAAAKVARPELRNSRASCDRLRGRATRACRPFILRSRRTCMFAWPMRGVGAMVAQRIYYRINYTWTASAPGTSQLSSNSAGRSIWTAFAKARSIYR